MKINKPILSRKVNTYMTILYLFTLMLISITIPCTKSIKLESELSTKSTSTWGAPKAPSGPPIILLPNKFKEVRGAHVKFLRNCLSMSLNKYTFVLKANCIYKRKGKKSKIDIRKCINYENGRFTGGGHLDIKCQGCYVNRPYNNLKYTRLLNCKCRQENQKHIMVKAALSNYIILINGRMYCRWKNKKIKH